MDKNRAYGALVGLAVGDAIGTTLEFMPRDTYVHLTDMVGGGPFKLKAGQWTDDTNMAVCLAESLVKRKGFDPIDQLERYVMWREKGYHSPKGYCFDIGTTTSSALTDFVKTKLPYRQLHVSNAGNGSLMRLAPIPIAYAHDIDLLLVNARLMSMTTHASNEANAACQAYAVMIARALNGQSKEEILDANVLDLIPDAPAKVKTIVEGSYKLKTRTFIRSGGYVMESLEAALWCFYNSTTFEDGVLMAANLGNDADTTAAIYGQLAGAFYGLDAINNTWLEKLWEIDMIKGLVDGLLELDKLVLSA